MSAYVKASSRLLVLCIAFCCVQGARASTFTIPTDDDLIVGARAIVRGKVLSMSCQLDDQSGRIFTYVQLRVREVLKGQVSQREIVLKEEGGQAGTLGSIIFGTPTFVSGEDVLLYLDTWRDGSLRVYQMFLGKFSIVDDPATGEQIVVRNSPDRDVSIVQSQSQTHGGGATSRMELSAYREMIRRREKATRVRSQMFSDAYYANTQMLATPAEYRSTVGDFAPQYTFLTSPPPRWFEPDVGQVVSFMVNPDGAPNPQIMDDISAAMNVWSSVPGCSLRVVTGGSAAICYSRDSNSIVFNNCEGQFAPSPTCASTLALGGMTWDTSQTKVINGTTFVRATIGHISFNPYASCDFGDHCIVREIATHELGHALGLGHSHSSDATMFGVAHFDGRCASIHQDDADAITFVYPAGAGGPAPLTIVSTSPLGIATAGSVFSRQLLATGGASPYSWSIVSGSLPDGLNLFQNGLVSGTPSATGSSDFTVKVTDSQNISVQKALSISVIAPASGFDSQFISQDVPATLNPGQAFFVTLRWTNNGSKDWIGGAGFSAISQNPPNNATWGGNNVPWFGSNIAPGGQIELLFGATAPARAGIYDFQWQLYQQGVGVFGQPSANVSIKVGDPAPPTPPSIAGPSSLAAVTGTLFSYTLTATGGTLPYTWQVAAGALPVGLTLNPNTGALVGTPIVAGNSAVTVQVTDFKSQTAQKILTFAVTAPAVAPLDITTSTMAGATKGVAFSQQLVAAGGKPPYTWTVTSGALPGGLSLAGTTGSISGTPGAIGVFNFSVTATDSESRTATRPLSITVAAPPLTIATVPALDGFKGSSFSYQLSATGGTPPYTWSVTSGAFPAGLTLSSASGLISGVPGVGGLFTFTVTVRDQASVSTTANVQISLVDPATLPAVTKAKYKGGKKLIVTGDRINAAAVLLMDGNQTPAILEDGSFLAKPITLASGRHEIRIANPGGLLSPPFILTVE